MPYVTPGLIEFNDDMRCNSIAYVPELPYHVLEFCTPLKNTIIITYLCTKLPKIFWKKLKTIFFLQQQTSLPACLCDEFAFEACQCLCEEFACEARTWVLCLELRVRHIGVEYRGDGGHVSMGLILLPLLEVLLVPWDHFLFPLLGRRDRGGAGTTATPSREEDRNQNGDIYPIYGRTRELGWIYQPQYPASSEAMMDQVTVNTSHMAKC